MSCINRSWSYRWKNFWFPFIIMALFIVLGCLLIWVSDLVGEAITLILSSVFWMWYVDVVRENAEKENLAKVLDVPAMEVDATIHEKEHAKLMALWGVFIKLNQEYSGYSYESKVPKEAREFTSEWHPTVESLIRACMFHGRSLAIVNKHNQIEIKV